MKIIVLLQENRTQLVLEPENEYEINVLKILEKLPNAHRDNFYDCQGGWTREDVGDRDLVIVFDGEIKLNK